MNVQRTNISNLATEDSNVVRLTRRMRFSSGMEKR